MKVTSYIILTLIIISQFASNVLYSYLRYEIRQEAKLVMKSSDSPELVRFFEFDEKELQKVNFIHSKEFMYLGNMFDIISKYSYNGITFIKCIIDYKEKAFLASYIANHSETNSINLLSLMTYIPYFLYDVFELDGLILEKKIIPSLYFTPKLLLVTIPIISPPPIF